MNIRETKNWRIGLHAEEECVHPDDLHDWSVDDREKTLSNIDNGVWIWFCARVDVVHKGTGAVLGEAFLGGCCYDSLEDFARNSGYLRDMVSEAITEARHHHENVCNTKLG